jgi:hypothetical protein
MDKKHGVYANAVYQGTEVDAQLTLDAAQNMGADTYFYLLGSMNSEFVRGKWVNVEKLLKEASRRDIDVWVTFANPIAYKAGKNGQYGKLMYFRQWMAHMSNLSKTYECFKGVVVDDFGEQNFWTTGEWLSFSREEIYRPDYMARLRETLEEINPDFRFAAVLYYPNIFTPISRRAWMKIREYVTDVIFPGWWKRGESPLVTENTEKIAHDYYIQRTVVKNGMTNEQKLWYCPYFTGHSWHGMTTPIAVTEQLNLCLSDPDIYGVYGYTLIRDPNDVKVEIVRAWYLDGY